MKLISFVFEKKTNGFSLILCNRKHTEADGFSSRDHSSVISQKSKALPETKNCPLLDILHHELNQPSTSSKPDPSLLRRDAAIQCSSEDANDLTNPSYPVLTGHLSAACTVSTMIRPRPGYSECGVQVDLGDVRIDSLEHLVELYADLLSSTTVRQFYDDCQSNIQWTRTQLDEYLQHRNDVVVVPTLQQLSLNSLNRWNEQIKSTNPTCDTISLDDLLQDINDEEMNEDFGFDHQSTDSSQIEVSDPNQMYLPWAVVHSLQELYGELPNTCFFESDHRGIALPIDDDLSITLYQALQRCVMEPSTKDSVTKPVNDNEVTTESKKKLSNNNQRWVIPSENRSTGDLYAKPVPSLKQIIQEEQHAARSQKTKQVGPELFSSPPWWIKILVHFRNVNWITQLNINWKNLNSSFPLSTVIFSSICFAKMGITMRSPSPVSRACSTKVLRSRSPNRSSLHVRYRQRKQWSNPCWRTTMSYATMLFDMVNAGGNSMPKRIKPTDTECWVLPRSTFIERVKKRSWWKTLTEWRANVSRAGVWPSSIKVTNSTCTACMSTKLFNYSRKWNRNSMTELDERPQSRSRSSPATARIRCTAVATAGYDLLF